MMKYVLIGVSLLIGGCARLESSPDASVTIKGVSFGTTGKRLEIGQMAPAFTALDTQFKPISLAQYRGRPVLISAVPSLDTPVCSLQAKRFNEAVTTLPADVAVMTISMDLPTAQKRFCSQENIERMSVLSDSARREFGSRYGVWIPERGLLARSVFVVGRDGRILYAEVVPEVSTHPDYATALDAARRAAEQSVLSDE